MPRKSKVEELAQAINSVIVAARMYGKALGEENEEDARIWSRALSRGMVALVDDHGISDTLPGLDAARRHMSLTNHRG